MDMGIVIGIVAALILVGLFLKQIKLFIVLALIIGGGIWFFILDDSQKDELTEAIENNEQYKELKSKADEKLDEVKDEVEESLEDAKKGLHDKTLEIYEEEKKKLSGE